jgi:hypothetical protein
MKTAIFERFDIDMRDDMASSCLHPGQCDADVAEALEDPHIANQLDGIGPEKIRAELRGYGAWDDAELADDAQNRARILWLAAGQIIDGP